MKLHLLPTIHKGSSGSSSYSSMLSVLLISLLLPLLSNALVIESTFQPVIYKTENDRMLSDILYYDDSPHVLMVKENNLYLSQDDGITWDVKLKDISKIHVDKVKKSRALAFTNGKTHYVSNDYGASWKPFEIENGASLNFEISVNSKNPDQVMLGFFHCPEGSSFSHCQQNVLYTTNGFETNPTVMVNDISYCLFTKSNDIFDKGDDNTVLCLKTTRDPQTNHITKSQVLSSNDFFISEPKVMNDADDILANNIAIEIEVIQSFIVVQVQLQSQPQSTGESKATPNVSGSGSGSGLGDSNESVLLFVSKDGTTFKQAHYEGQFKPSMFSFLPSTKESLFISSWGTDSGTPVANVFSSDSEGLYFRNILDHIQGSILGFLNIDKFEQIEGSWMANVYEGYDEDSFFPKTRSKITFDDGRSWSYLRVTDDANCKGDEECSLNLLSLDERRGDGQGATGATPGILLGVGVTGSDLGRDLFKMKTYVSRDGGITWKKTLDKATVFAFGDLGNILVAAPYIQQNSTDGNTTSTELVYSLDQGETWQSFNIDTAVFPLLLTTAIDGSTSKFIYVGMAANENGELDYQILYTLDFSKAFPRVCSEPNDFETWYGRSEVTETQGKCIYGHKDVYKRRKQDADCFINKPYEDLKVEEVPCECSNYDYECNFGFIMNSKGECVEDSKALLQLCSKEPKGKLLELETKRKIPGNMCKGGSSSLKIPVAGIDCNRMYPDGSIVVVPNEFEGSITYYAFLEHSTSSNDETLIVKNSKNQVFISQNGGRDFKMFTGASSGSSPEGPGQILEIHINPYFANNIYLIGTNRRIFISEDRGYSFTERQLPSDLSIFGLSSLTFKEGSSANASETFIFYGVTNECEDNTFSEACRSMAFITENNGATWQNLIIDARTCDFVGARYTEFNAHKDLIYCEVLNQISTGYSLVSSTDKFSQQKDILYGNIVGFASTTHFTVVAAIHEDDSLKAYVTVDGQTFAEALFPADFQVNKQQAYTILGSETGAIFLHVTSNDRPGSEFGAILKSNSNGTSYVLSERYANRNSPGYVDFERVEGLEGIAIINTVSNYEEAASGALKELVSKITFNDGADWDYIQPPRKNSFGIKYKCLGSSLQECSLHLHGYTERKDVRDTFSSNSATGILLGVGNVGSKLTSYKDSDTFLSSDGGLTWKEVAKGPHQWEFGDQGSVIVLIDERNPSNTIQFSLNSGDSWQYYHITEKGAEGEGQEEHKIQIEDIVTVPSDTSTRFMLTTKSLSNDKSHIFTVDFDGLFERDCVLSVNEPNNDDFEYWSPSQPFSASSCLFGHEVQYLRKLADRTTCKIGKTKLHDSYKKIRDCPCTRRDFECDFNYAKAKDGTCKLVENWSIHDPAEVCKVDSKTIEYFEPSGYRKIPMNTCKGGTEFDKIHPKPCPGHEKQFDEIHGGIITGSGWGLVILVPLFVFFSAIWFVYDRGIKRNGGFQRFGEIRLGDQDDDLIENNNTDKVVNAIVRGGVTAVAIIVALYQTVRVIDSRLLDRIKGTFRRDGRYSARGAGYTNVAEQDFRDHAEDLSASFADNDNYEAQNFDIDDDDFGYLSGGSETENTTSFAEEATHQSFRDEVSGSGDNNEEDLGDVFSEYHDDRNLE